MRLVRPLALLLPLALLTACAGGSDDSPAPSPAAAPTATAGAGTDAASATRLVEALYARQAQGRLLQSAPAQQLADVVTPELAGLLLADRQRAGGEVGALDMDPLYAAQDAQVSGLQVAPATVQGRTASVAVTFTNVGRPGRVTLQLAALATGWRVGDVRYADGRTLAGILRG